MSKFRITDGKGFGITFANGWSVSVQFGRGNYADNYDERSQDGESYEEVNRRCGKQGSDTAECAAVNPSGKLVVLPVFMFAHEDSYRDTVSNRSTPEQVLQLMTWVASQPSA